MTRLGTALAASAVIALVSPANAQDHSMHGMPGMAKPAPAKKAPPKKARAASVKAASRKISPAPRTKAPTAPAAATMPVMPGMNHPGHDTPPPATEPAGAAMDHPNHGHPEPSSPVDHRAMPGMPTDAGRMDPVGTALPAGNAPAPRPPMDHFADRQFPASEMQRSRDVMMQESGGQSFSQVMFNLAEYQARKGRDGYRWDGEAWFGSDINRLTLKSEGEGAFREGIESAEIQALYSRAVGPYFNLQAGVRHDFEPGRPTTYATVGFEGLAPYWFEVEGAAFLSDKGDILARLEGYYDQRITQRVVLQPRVELNLSAQNVPETRTGAGLSSAELGLRLRYDITRKFSPYVGVSYEAKTGQTARYARADGEDPTVTSFVAGIRLWF